MDMKKLSDVINDFRVFPRLFSLFYLYWMGEVILWSMGLPPGASSSAQWLVAAVTVPGAAWFKIYVDSGGNK